MPTEKRITLQGVPHLITQRGTRKDRTFFCREDYVFYLKTLFRKSSKHKLEILAYCLMPNHIHIIGVPLSERSLSLAIGVTHQLYTKYINERKKWQGCLWQSRFYSVPLDEAHFDACMKYVHLNPVKAGLVDDCTEYPWSSAWKDGKMMYLQGSPNAYPHNSETHSIV